MAGDDLPLYLTVAEAADMVRMGESTLRKLIKRGEGPPVSKLGKLLRIYRPAFDAWAQGDRKVATASDDDNSDDNRSDNTRIQARIPERENHHRRA